MNKPPSQRMLRVGELVRHALADMLTRGEIIDPLIESTVITIPEVRMSPDLKLANAYVAPLGGLNADNSVIALNKHKKFIRGFVTPKLNLKYAPDIRFFVDDTFDEATRIDNLLRSEKVLRDIKASDDVSDDANNEETSD